DERSAQPVPEPVLDRVFHQRLQDEGWRQSLLRAVLDFEADRKGISHSHLLDFQVCLRELDLGFERALRGGFATERYAQQVAQPCEHAARGPRLYLRKYGNVLQRIE